MKKAKKIIILMFVVLIVLISWFVFNKNRQSESIKGEVQNHEINDEKITWDTYEDPEYHFTISHPSHLDKSVRYEVSNEEGKYDLGKLIKGVSFSYEGFGFAGVKIYSDLDFKNIDEFLEFKNNQREMVRYEVEKEFYIDEIPVVVFHTVSVPPKDSSGQTIYTEEHFLTEKRAVFLKDGKLFKIWTRSGDEKTHEKIWNSFKFLDSE